MLRHGWGGLSFFGVCLRCRRFVVCLVLLPTCNPCYSFCLARYPRLLAFLPDVLILGSLRWVLAVCLFCIFLELLLPSFSFVNI